MGGHMQVVMVGRALHVRLFFECLIYLLYLSTSFLCGKQLRL